MPIQPENLSLTGQKLNMEQGEPLVSAVIPTRDKPDLVVRAVRSALAQTLAAIEIIVIIDGPDELTVAALGAIEDSRVRIIVLPHNMGPAEARNAGVAEARSRWVAFLDHDDEWLPEKLSLQLEACTRSPYRYPIIGCRLLVRQKWGNSVWPRRFPQFNEVMSEYLFCRTKLLAGEGLIQSSMIFTERVLLQMIPFRKEAQRHDDLDWVLRATMLNGAGVQFVSEAFPLAIWHRDDPRDTISNNPDWRFSLSWINKNKDLVTRRAYASFLMTWLSANAVKQGHRKECFVLLRQAFRYGQPSVLDTILFLGIWLCPPNLRAKMVLLFSDRRQMSPDLFSERASETTRPSP